MFWGGHFFGICCRTLCGRDSLPGYLGEGTPGILYSAGIPWDSVEGTPGIAEQQTTRPPKATRTKHMVS